MAIKFEGIQQTQKRVNRRPRHSFNIVTRPWQIQPFMIAPVLPGETMKQLLHQSRTVSKPVLNPLIGWWLEHYYFYVKLNDMDGRATFQAMFIDLSTSVAGLHTAAAARNYHVGSTLDFVEMGLKRIVEEYFRVPGESYTVSTIDSVPVANFGIRSFLESAINEDAFVALASTDPNIDLDASGVIRASEVDKAMATWHYMSQNKLTEMTYEDFLRTYGVNVPEAEDPYIPELIRFERDWQFPTNHVNAATGTPSSAMVWSTSFRADKDRFFQEPGFIMGVQVARPKVYLSRQTSIGSAMLDNALAWLPPTLIQNRQSRMKRFVAAAGYPITSTTDDIYIDVADLYLHGDQFINYAPATVGYNQVPFPAVGDPDIDSQYPVAATADLMFAAASPANTLNTDGVCDLTVASRISDQT